MSYSRTSAPAALRTSPGLTGAALLFWGWQTGLVLPALLLALFHEGLRASGLRFSLQPRDFGRFVDLSLLLFVGQGVYLALTPLEESLLLQLGQWLPVTLTPLALAETVSESGQVSIQGLFATVRRKASLARKRQMRFCFGPSFVLLTLFAAGCANTRSPLFYGGLALLMGWWLLGARPQRFALRLWLPLLGAVLLLGFLSQWSIHEVQETVRGWVRRDPFKMSTAVGAVGAIKLSDRIALRVQTKPPLQRPMLLREASYDFFDGQAWHATNGEFSELTPVPESRGETWQLLQFGKTETPLQGMQPAQDALPFAREVTIYQYFRWRGGLLPLPLHASSILNLPGAGMGQNRFGTVKVSRAPGLTAYTAVSEADSAPADPPTVVDRVTLPGDAPLLREIVATLGLETVPPVQRLQRIKDYFFEEFHYTLSLERNHPELSPLSEFLQYSKAGHCEYFAMAAVFLLRQSGIPARYTIGYAVHEFDPDGQMYLVRERDAHAWALAYVQNRWLPLDATPPAWIAAYGQPESWLRELADLRQDLAFWFARWRWLGQDAQTRRILLWTVAPLLLFLFWRLGRSLRLQRHRKSRSQAVEEFAKVEARLAKTAPRGLAEPLGGYLRRLEADGLQEALRLYYTARFDPLGLSQEGRMELRKQVDAWLAKRKA